VMPSDFTQTLAARLGVEPDRAGRIQVTDELTVPGHPDIYLVGDIALVRGGDGAPLPGVCQVAMQQGVYAARSILARCKEKASPKPFRYFNKGQMAVIGRGAAVADMFGVRLSGVVAWMIWLCIHLLYLVNFQNRVLVFVQWGFQYLTFSRSQRLITGARHYTAAGWEGLEKQHEQKATGEWRPHVSNRPR
jgi:NADH:ubiquinone reductase (H+-translocating)